MSSDILDKPIIAKDHETDGFCPFSGQVLTHSSKRFVMDEILDEIYLEAREENSRLPSPYALMTNRVSKDQLENGIPEEKLIANKERAMFAFKLRINSCLQHHYNTQKTIENQ